MVYTIVQCTFTNADAYNMISAKMINRADVSGVNCFSFGGKRMPFGDGNVSATYKYKQMIN